MFKIKKSMILTAAILAGTMTFANIGDVSAKNVNNSAKGDRAVVKAEKLNLTKDWDKVFKKSDKVNHRKVTFVNRFGITLAADLYEPKNISGKLPALAICGAFGAVKEQISGYYAQTMAERGFITIAFDPSFTGESGGQPRYVASPDINTEDFSAAVDFLSVQDNVDADKIGIIGICGWGGLALNAAAIDTRIKATVTTTMYDMSRVNANGYFDYNKDEATIKSERQKLRENLNNYRTSDYRNGIYEHAGGVPGQLPDDAPQFVKDYFDFYKTARGYHERSLNSNKGWNTTSALSFINTQQLSYVDEIKNPVLIIHGEKAHSRYFSEDAFDKMTNSKHEKGKNTVVGNKELMIIPNANHTDLYDGGDNNYIPFDKIEKFFKDNLK